MYKANLSWGPLSTHLVLLETYGLLEEVNVEEFNKGPKRKRDSRTVTTYMTTRKGVEWRNAVWKIFDTVGGSII